MAEKIAFVGLGIMGKPMAKNLIEGGYELYVYDLFPEPVIELEKVGATGCKSAAEASSNANITVTMVQDGPQAESAITGKGGVIEGASNGHLVVDMSSIAPGVSQRIGKACDDNGVNFLDAPVSCGEPFAISGELAIMVGGSAEHFEQAKPLFDILGKSAILCGAHGAGQVTKLANQICVGANIHALAEALTLAAKSGVNPETVYKAIAGGLAGSNVINAKAPMMVDRNFEPGFRIELHYKDINNAMEAARDLNLPLQVTSNLQQVLTSLMIQGEGKSDHSAIAKYVEQLAGVEIKKH